MSTVSCDDTNGRSLALDETTISTFADWLRGPLLRPGDDAYGGARRVWNGTIDRQPAGTLQHGRSTMKIGVLGTGVVGKAVAELRMDRHSGHGRHYERALSHLIGPAGIPA